MEFTTQSEHPINAELREDGYIDLVCKYEYHDYGSKRGNLEKYIKIEHMTLTYNELEQIYNAFKKIQGETE